MIRRQLSIPTPLRSSKPSAPQLAITPMKKPTKNPKQVESMRKAKKDSKKRR